MEVSQTAGGPGGAVGGGAKQKTGTYVGDGTTSMGVTGVGFQPDYVSIWTRITVGNSNMFQYETTDTIIDDNASKTTIESLKTEFRTVLNRIISLDPDGFSVSDNSSNANPNMSGVTYNYLASKNG